MDQCRKVREQLMDRWGKRGNQGTEKLLETGDLNCHLADCASCRKFEQSLQTLGRNLDDLGAWADDGTVIPGMAYFEKLVNGGTLAGTVPFGNGLGNRVHIREILAFLTLGILILTGAGVAVYNGYLLPVGIIFGLTAMQAPLLILLRTQEQERGGFSNEA